MLNQALRLTNTRIVLGLILFAHSNFFKFEISTIDGTGGFFARIGLPTIAAYLVIAREILGGIILILGALTRLAA